MIDYRYLKAFILTAEHSSFSQAAKLLGIAQSAVSRQIKLLEENLGEELIVRSSKKVLLTQKGKELYNISLNFDKTATDLFNQEDNRPIKIGVLHGLLEHWLTQVITLFYKKSTRGLDITVDSQPQLKKGLSDGMFDIIFTTENIQSELISSLHIFDERLLLISKKEIDKKKLEQYLWIVYSDVDNMFRLAKKTSQQILRVDSITSIVTLVKNKVGIAIVPDHMVKPTDGLKTYELPELGKSEIYMGTLNYKLMPRHIREFVSLVTSNGPAEKD